MSLPLEEWRLCMRVTALPRSAPPSSPHPPLGEAAFYHENTPLGLFWNFFWLWHFPPNKIKISDWLETLLGADYRALLWMGDGTADRCELLLLSYEYDAKTASGLCPLSALTAPPARLPFCHAAYAALLVLNLTPLKLLKGVHVLSLF